MKKHSARKQKGLWHNMFQLLRQARLPYFLIFMATAAALARTQVSLLIPSYMQQFYAGDFSTKVIIMLITANILRYLVANIVNWLNKICGAKVTRNIRKSLVQRLFRMPMTFYENNTPKSLISRTTDDTTKMSDFISTVAADVISSLYGIIGICALLFTYQWQLGIAILAIMPVTAGIFILCGKMNFRVNYMVQAKLAELTKSIMERVLRIPLIKATVNEEAEEQEGSKDIQAFYRTRLRFGVATGSISTLQMLNQYLRDIIVILVGFLLVRNGIITTDIFIAFFLYESQLCGYIATLLNKWSELKGCQGCVQRISEICTEEEETTAGEAAVDFDGTLRFENVSFSYQDKPVLHDISFTVPSRQITAIVGRSGAGKSTILKLISALYPISGGKILVAGKNLSSLDRRQWRRSIAYVSQDMQMFSGTIRENLLYGLNRDVDDDAIKEALATACADKFVAAFPKGLDEQVGLNGAKLSGGQSRRLMIARALLKETQYLLLDEITANLDIESKLEINKVIHNISREKTVIMISHDMQAVAQADRILVIDAKTLESCGTHQELMRRSSVYRQLQSSATA